MIRLSYYLQKVVDYGQDIYKNQDLIRKTMYEADKMVYEDYYLKGHSGMFDASIYRGDFFEFYYRFIYEKGRIGTGDWLDEKPGFQSVLTSNFKNINMPLIICLCLLSFGIWSSEFENGAIKNLFDSGL